MSDFRVWGQRSPQPTSDGNWVGARGLNDGTVVTAPWTQAEINASRGFVVTVGSFSTPITGGGAGTIVDQDQPEAIISVPSGTAIEIVSINVQTQVPLLATDADECEILVAVDKDTAYAGDGTVTPETPLNLRMNATATSSVTAASAATANITNPTLDLELARSVVTGDVNGVAANALWTKNELNYAPAQRPVLVGPCALYVYWGGTVATPGFAQITYIENTGDRKTALYGS